MKCDGEEKHSHYKLATDQLFYHTHTHSDMKEDFNRLHHHPPVDHSHFTDEELERDAEIVDVPF